MPRMATAQRTAIASPATGLQVYDTDTNSQWYYNGTAWVQGASKADASKFTNDATNTRVALTNLSDGTTARPAGTEFLITDDGKVGIGTSTPNQSLEMNVGEWGGIRVNGGTASSGVNGLELRNDAAAVYNIGMFGSAYPWTEPGSLFFYGGSVPDSKMILSPSGNLRIADGAANATNAKLEVVGNVNPNASVARFVQSGQNLTVGQSLVNIKATTANSQAYALHIENTAIPSNFADFFVTADGKVGIGTSTPNQNLELNVGEWGGIRVNGGTASSGVNGIELRNDAAAVYNIGMFGSAYPWTEPGSLFFYGGSDPDSKMILSPSGNLRIAHGTSNATNAKLEVVGNVNPNASVARFVQSGQNLTVGQSLVNIKATTANSQAYALHIENTAIPSNFADFFVTADGKVGIGNANPTANLVVNGPIKVGNTDSATPEAGWIRFNTSSNKFQGYDGTTWVDFH